MLGRARRKRGLLKLQLTSLLDMFTIILVFLLVSFQAEDKDFVLHSGLQLPVSSAQNPAKTAVNVAVAMDGVYVEGKRIYKLEEGGKLKAKPAEARHVPAVTKAVSKAWEIKEQQPDFESDDRVVVIQSDKGMPYQTLHTVMRSAALAGFFRFRMIVEKE